MNELDEVLAPERGRYKETTLEELWICRTKLRHARRSYRNPQSRSLLQERQASAESDEDFAYRIDQIRLELAWRFDRIAIGKYLDHCKQIEDENPGIGFFVERTNRLFKWQSELRATLRKMRNELKKNFPPEVVEYHLASLSTQAKIDQ